MGQKEKLICQYFELKNRFDSREPGCINIWPAIPSPVDIYNMSREYKVIDLENKISSVMNALEKQSKRIAIENYFNSHEGKKFKEENEAALNKLSDVYDSLKRSYVEKIENAVNDFMGGNFVSRFSYGYKSWRGEIGIKNNEPDRPGFFFKFGHDFNVYYDKKDFYNKETKKWESYYAFEMNYGTLGSFNLLNDPDRIEYVAGLGKFANAKDFKENLVNIMVESIGKLSAIEKEISVYDNKLKNPFNN